MPVSYGQVVGVANPNQGGVDVPLIVSGTVSSAPSGTQDVNVVAPNPLPVSVSNTVTTIGGLDPAIDGVYLFSANDVSGVAATNNFLTLTNPVGSGKVIYMPYVAISSYAYTGGAAISNSMIVSVATAVSGGTNESASILKFNAAYPAASGVVRSGNPAATAGPSLIGVPSGFISGSGVAVSLLATLQANAASGTIALTEGNSFLFRTIAGDTDQRWNFTIAWLEI